MIITNQDLGILYPEQLLIPFSQDDKQQAWQEATTENTDNRAVVWNNFLNRLCLKYIPYLKSDLADDYTVETWQPQEQLSKIWQLVNGNAIDISSSENAVTTRIVLIPTNDDTNELRVPREWLDLSDWVGNYYVAIQINEEDNYLQVRGYATYEDLLEKGYHDVIDETYSLTDDNLTEDLTSMYISLELYPCDRPQLENRYVVNPNKLPEIIDRLKSTTMVLPRLEIPFGDWGAIINNPETRYFLNENKLDRNIEQSSLTDKIIKSDLGVNLLEWLENSVISGWQTLDSLINNDRLNLAYSYRRNSTNKIVERVKLIQIPTDTNAMQTLALVVRLEKTPENKYSLKIQLNSTSQDSTLPDRLKLQMISPKQRIIQEVESRNNDSSIQLKQFTTSMGKKFMIQIVKEDFSWVENFLLS